MHWKKWWLQQGNAKGALQKKNGWNTKGLSSKNGKLRKKEAEKERQLLTEDERLTN